MKTQKIDRAQQQIIQEMAGLTDAMDKYKYLIEQAEEFKGRDDTIRSEPNLIHGCQSSVWLCVRVEDDRVLMQADSEARIVRGILALLHRVINNRPRENVIETELYFLEQTGLREHLSPHRANGLQSIVDEIKNRCKGESID